MKHQQMNAWGLSQQDVSMEHPVWTPKSKPFQYCLDKLVLLDMVKEQAEGLYPKEVFGTKWEM